MSAYYWSKLPHSFFDDRRIDSLEPELYKIFIKLFLLAGIENGDKKTGALPEFDDIVYRLRYWDDEQLETAMVELQGRRLLSMIDGEWYVADFETVQAPHSTKERVAEYRKRKTQELADINQDDVTKRYTEEKRKERSRREEEEKNQPSPSSNSIPPSAESDAYIQELTDRFTKDHTREGYEVVEHLAKGAVLVWIADLNKAIRKGKNVIDYKYGWVLERYTRLLAEANAPKGSYLGEPAKPIAWEVFD